MRKKLETKFLHVNGFPTKRVESMHHSFKLDPDSETTFDDYLDEEPIFHDCFESEFEENQDDTELRDKPTFNYCFESEFEETQHDVDDRN